MFKKTIITSSFKDVCINKPPLPTDVFDHNFQFNSSVEGSLSKFLFETAHSAYNSTYVDALNKS